MKRFFTLVIFLLSISCWVSGQTRISIDDANKHYGEIVTICDKVYGGRFMEYSKNKITLLNMGGAYPNHKLTISISNESRKNFKEKPEEVYVNKVICVTGKVVEFNGKPEIVITKPEEIENNTGEGTGFEIKVNDFFNFQ